MEINFMKKGLVFGIIVLFVGTSIVPSQMAEDELKIPTVATMQTTWYVIEGGNNSNGGTNWSDAWRDINYAINYASVGDDDDIRVGDGNYTENVVIDKQLEIVGNGSSISIIDGNGAGSVVTIEASEVTIQDFTIRNSGNTISDDAGIYINNSKDVKIFDNTISYNQANGILIVGWILGEPNTIQNNQISNNDADGISLLSSNGNEIYQNIIKDNGLDGIFMWSSSSNKIGKTTGDGNNISGNLQSGIHMYGLCTGNAVHKNYINNNKEGGIFLDTRPSANTFNQNTISNNTEYGIYLVLGCISNLIRKNNFINNTPKHATFVNCFLTRWQLNYWDDWKGWGVYWIWGRIIFIPWPNVDPAPSHDPW